MTCSMVVVVVVPLNLDCTKERRQCVVGDQNIVNFCVTLVCNECDIDEDTVLCYCG